MLTSQDPGSPVSVASGQGPRGLMGGLSAERDSLASTCPVFVSGVSGRHKLPMAAAVAEGKG